VNLNQKTSERRTSERREVEGQLDELARSSYRQGETILTHEEKGCRGYAPRWADHCWRESGVEGGREVGSVGEKGRRWRFEVNSTEQLLSLF